MVQISTYDTEIYDETRGNVTAGSRLLQPYIPPDTPEIGFSSDTSSQTVIISDESQTTFVFKVINTPIRSKTVHVSVEGRSLPNIDDGIGNILGKGLTGSINYSTGVVTVILTESLEKDKKVTLQYSQDFEIPARPSVLGKEFSIRFDEYNKATIKIKKEQYDKMNASVDGLEYEVLKLLKKKVKRELSKL